MLAQARPIFPGSDPREPSLEFSGVSIPMGGAGGDVLEMLPTRGEATAVYVADAVGKGASAGWLRSLTRSAFRSATRRDADPGVICGRVNALLCERFAPGEFATAFFGVIDRERSRLSYTRAGHNPALLARADGSVLRLMDGGGILGAFRDWTYEQGHVELCPGDRLLLYTDGLTEATDLEGSELGERRVARLLRRHRDLRPRRIRRSILAALHGWSDGCRTDDVTLGVLEVR